MALETLGDLRGLFAFVLDLGFELEVAVVQ